MANTPTVTRSYKSREIMDAREYFALQRLLSWLHPDELEWETILMASVAASAYESRRGAKSPFPAPIDFVDSLFGYGAEHEPVWHDEIQRYRSTLMIRTVHKMITYIHEMWEHLMFCTVDIPCPYCQKDMGITFGWAMSWNDRRNEIDIEYDHIRMLKVDLNCACEDFNTSDFIRLEKTAGDKVYESIFGDDK